jgi:hypothetical protein
LTINSYMLLKKSKKECIDYFGSGDHELNANIVALLFLVIERHIVEYSI